jgi:hypothetical protein
VLRQIPDQRPDRARNHCQQHELSQRQTQHVAMLGTEAFHERYAVQVAREESPCSHSHSDTAEQHADECREDQEPLGSLDGPAHDRPSIANVLEFLIYAEERLDLLTK